VRRAGVSGHFTFLPQVDDIADVINLVDIGVITSVTSETISRVLLEFMYLGKPVVATDVNAIGEIVVPGVTGERIPRGNSEALTKAILKLADHSDLCRAYGHNAAAQYGKRYSEARFYRQYLGIFNALTKDKH
jgi:glycosyltransferase involved in cell wall biosynthesis